MLQWFRHDLTDRWFKFRHRWYVVLGYSLRRIMLTLAKVQQGHFDIMFPTNFKVAEAMYRAITGKLTQVLAQEDYLQRWAFIEDTRTLRGDNPLLNWYKNASVLLTV